MLGIRKPTSLKGALFALLLPAGVGLMAIAWLVHGLLLDRMAREFVEGKLRDEAAFLEHHIREADGQLDTLQPGDYFQEVFHHAFAIKSPTRTIISPEAWAPVLSPLLGPGPDGPVRLHGAELAGMAADILAYRSSFRVRGVPIVVIVSEDLAALKRSQSELHAWTAVVSILLILLLVGVIWIGITISMRPVASLQLALRKLQSGEAERIDVHSPEEFQPLVHQLNLLLDSLDRRLERSREALANLSHSVKTPIAAVRQILADSARPLDNALRHQLTMRLDDINQQLDAEMRRSQFAGPQVGKTAYPLNQARDLLWMLGRLYPEKSFELSTELSESSRWPIEEHDLNEIMGNLLDNAGKWSQQYIELLLVETAHSVKVVVEDDGPGVGPGEIGNLGQRGVRLDEQTPGHGLGLAIVREIVERYGGQTRFSDGLKGGLRVAVEVPIRPSSFAPNR